jgi:hypothetical protein
MWDSLDGTTQYPSRFSFPFPREAKQWDSLDGTTQYPSRFSFPFPREAKHKQVYVTSGPVQITTPKPKELSSFQVEPLSVSTLTEPPPRSASVLLPLSLTSLYSRLSPLEETCL